MFEFFSGYPIVMFIFLTLLGIEFNNGINNFSSPKTTAVSFSSAWFM